MIPHLTMRLTGEWQPYLHSAGVCLVPPLHVVQQSGAPGAARKIVFLVFSAAATKPVVALKVVRDPANNDYLAEEFANLNSLWQRPAAQPGIPQPIGLWGHEKHLVLAEKMLPGAPMSLLLRRNRQPRRHLSRVVSRYLHAATTWLGRFQDSGPTAMTTTPDADTIAARLARLPAGGLPPAFVTHLQQQAGRFRGLTLPLVNAHGDFWPGNLLWEDKQGLRGIYDWEAFHPARTPFYDLFLFITTLALECTWVGENRAARFQFGFQADTWLSRLMASVVTTLFERHQLPHPAASFFYALFLLEMATPDAAAGAKQREQAGSWRALLQQVACTPAAYHPFAMRGAS